MKKKITVHNIGDIESCIEDIKSSADEIQIKLAEMTACAQPLELLYRIKFEDIGFDPFNAERPLNFIEQINQTFTYLATLKAAQKLLIWYSGLTSLTLNLGTQSGSDIETDYDGGITAEVFAAVTPGNNDKLKKDIEKISKSQASHKYVFFMCPGYDEGPYPKAPNGIKIWSLGNDY